MKTKILILACLLVSQGAQADIYLIAPTQGTNTEDKSMVVGNSSTSAPTQLFNCGELEYVYPHSMLLSRTTQGYVRIPAVLADDAYAAGTQYPELTRVTDGLNPVSCDISGNYYELWEGTPL